MTLAVTTDRVYYRDTYLGQLDATILETGKDKDGSFVVLDKTIFHPQGGGQPDDTGFMEVNGVKVAITKLDAPKDPQAQPYPIKHYYQSDDAFENGQAANLTIDMDRRKYLARLHTSAHLISNVVHSLTDKAIDGKRSHHFDQNAFVIFDNTYSGDLAKLLEEVNKTVTKVIAEGAVVHNNWEQDVRMIQIEGFNAYPCGGTHVNNTSDIGALVVTKLKNEKSKDPQGNAIQFLKASFTIKA